MNKNKKEEEKLIEEKSKDIIKALLYSGHLIYDKKTEPVGFLETQELVELKKDPEKLNKFLNEMVQEYEIFKVCEELANPGKIGGLKLLNIVDDKGNELKEGYSEYSGLTVKEIENTVKYVWRRKRERDKEGGGKKEE